MKTLKNFMEQTGYLKVKSPDEQKFVDKHEVAVAADRAGNGDDVFKAAKIKPIDRRKERKGYNPGEDEQVYEALKGDQHKIDANKNGKLDAHDFLLLRAKKKKMKEEAEQIDELSTATLQSYRKKARAQGNAIVDKMKMGGGDWSKDQKDTKTLRKRAAGAQASGKQLVKRGESLKTEEADLVEGMSAADRYSATHASAKALVKSINDHLNAHKDAATKSKSYSGKKGPTWGHVGDIDHVHSQLKDIHDRLASQGEYAMHEEVELDEKTLTPAELKKREEVAKAMERENPGMNKSKKMAIATATAKKVAEETLTGLIGDLSEANQKTMLAVFDKLSEENRAKFVEACETPEGVEAMLDFAIQNRGK